MKTNLLKLLFVFIVFSCTSKQEKKHIKNINFNLGISKIQPQKNYSNQGVTILGCNTMVSNMNKENWHSAPNGLIWNKKNQLFKNVPYGNKIDKTTKESYYVSKYYIVSPPVFHRNKNGTTNTNTKYDIGIVTPHEFTFERNQTVQQVNFNYDVLKLMEIKYIPILFDDSFNKLNVDIVPFKVECKDFPWLDKKTEGASGIGFLNRKNKNLKELFLPYYKDELTTNQSKKYLDFEVTILNDILFHHEIYFMIDGKKTNSINLKEFYENHINNNKIEITLHCDYVKELPCGCLEPK